MDMTPFIMVLLGCGQADYACQPVATLPVAYASEQSCMAARVEILDAMGDATLVAECRREASQTPVRAKAPATA